VTSPPTFDAAIRRLAPLDPVAASDARSVAGWLACVDDDPRHVTLADLQRFLWLELPRKWLMTDHDEWVRIAESTARLFEILERPGYASLCRSKTTADVLEAHSRSDSAGLKAFRTALHDSGVEPQDLADFVWGSYFGLEEAHARQWVENGLETAMQAGRFTVKVGNWRSLRTKTTAELLDEPHPGYLGQSWRSVIITERLASWVGMTRQAASLSTMRASAANMVLHPIAVPDDAAELLEPVLWICDRLREGGCKLTARGNLARVFVHAVATERDWWSFRPLPRSEEEFFELSTLHAWLRSSRLAQHESGRLMLTVPGIGSSSKIGNTWTRLATTVAGSKDFDRAAFETMILPILSNDGCAWADALQAATAALSEYGWHTGPQRDQPATGPLTELVVASAVHTGFGRLRLLGGIIEEGDWRERTIRLTPTGRAFVLTYLRDRAAGPQHAATR
jgi:hypothetical protein